MIAQVSVAIGVIYLIATIISFFFLSILVFKSGNIWIEKKTDEYTLKFQDYFTYIQVHIDNEENLRIPPSRLNRIERYVIQKKLIELIERFKGSHQEKLIKLCKDLELIKFDLERLNSLLHWKRIQAVYNLGAMQSELAVPRLLQLLESSKYDPTIFIIARSIAKCAQDVESLRNMVLYLIRHRKNFHQLIVDILKESEIDCTSLLMEFLYEEDIDLIKVALIGLPSHIVSNNVCRLYHLMCLEDKEIRIKVIKLLSSDNIPLVSAATMIQDDEKSKDFSGLSDLEKQLLYQKRMSQKTSSKEHYTQAV